MPKPFDATPKHLEETFPQDWAQFLGVKPATRVNVIDADVSTATYVLMGLESEEGSARQLLHSMWTSTKFHRASVRQFENRKIGRAHV